MQNNKDKKKGKTIKSEVTKTFAILSIIMLVIAGTLTYSSFKSIGSFKEIKASHLNKVYLSSDIEKSLISLIYKYKILSTGNASEPLSVLAELDKDKKLLISSIENLRLLDINSKNNENKSISTVENLVPKLEEIGKQMTIAFLNGEQEQGAQLSAKVNDLSNQLFVSIEELNTNIISRVNKDVDSITNFLKKIGNGAAILMVVSIFLTIYLTIMLLKFINNSVKETTFKLQKQTEKISEDVRNIVSILDDSSNTLSITADDLSEMSSKLTKSTSDQSSALQESVASIEEITSMTKQTADHSKTSMEVATKTRDDVKIGNNVVDKMRTSMSDIANSTEQMGAIISIFNDINNKTNVINEIVTKTQLLSFNASIEAARAGEHGKGFAVVAEEVGNLARLSGQASEEIRQLLDASIEKVNEIVKTIKPRVESGEQVSDECVEVFKIIEEQIINLSGMVNSISSAANEQQQGLEQGTQAMILIEKSTHENKMLIDQASQMANKVKVSAKDVIKAIADLDKMTKKNKEDLYKLTESYGNVKKSSLEENSKKDKVEDKKEEEASFDPNKVAELYKKSIEKNTKVS